MPMRKLLLGFAFVLWSGLALAADNILISQPNGTNAIIRSTESGGIQTLVTSCPSCGITVGTSVITGGTNTRVLFDDGGVVGESAGLTFIKGNGGSTSNLNVGGVGGSSAGLVYAGEFIAVSQAYADGDTWRLNTTNGLKLPNNRAVNWTSSVGANDTIDTTLSRSAAGILQVGTAAANALGSLLLVNITPSGAIINTGITTDATHTDSTVCQDTTTHQFYAGSGALGICLGTSGRQFKQDFAPMTAGLAEITKLDLQRFRYRKGFGDDGARLQYGLMAQDVEKVLPDLAGHDADGETINYDAGALLFVSIRAIQELNSKVKALEAR